MQQPLSYWCGKYRELLDHALCLDIETTGWNQSISVIGLYRPASGVPEILQLVRGKDLTKENVQAAFSGAQLLITYNGFALDIKRINEEFPGCIPKGIIVFDLFYVAQRLGIHTDLKVLENTFGIERLDEFSKRKYIAVKLWKQYQRRNDLTALSKLLEYNRQDTINLYPLAEELCGLVRKAGC